MGEKTMKEAFSFNGWDLWEFVKGRKKNAVTVVGVLLGYVLTDSELAAVIAGSLVEMAFAVGDYYITKKVP